MQINLVPGQQGSNLNSPFKVLWAGLLFILIVYFNNVPFFQQDTDVIVWDIVNECGLYRLKGHKGLVTKALFFRNKNLLVTRFVISNYFHCVNKFDSL